MKAVRVLVVNQHTQNSGDEAAGVALVNLLMDTRRVESIDIIYNGLLELPNTYAQVVKPSGVELQDIGRLNLALYFFLGLRAGIGRGGRALRKFRGLVRQADLVFVAPSGANIGIYRDWAFLVRLLIAVREGACPIFHYNTVGASGSPLFDALAMRVLRSSTMYVREQASKDFLARHGIDSTLGPDTAFALEPILCDIRRDVLSFVPSELDSWHPEFRTVGANDMILGDLSEQLACFAIGNGLSVEIVPHLRSATERQFNLLVREALIASGMSPSSVVIRDSITTVFEYDQALASSRLVVGGRYHAVVLAAKNHRPFVALSYENKMMEASRYLGMDDYCVDLHARDDAARRFRDSLGRVLSRELELSERLRRTVQDNLVSAVQRPLRDLGLTC